MVVGDQGSFFGRVYAPVVPDSGGQGQEFGSEAGVDSGQGPTAVGFEAELAFEGVEDRFDPLPDLAQAGRTGQVHHAGQGG